MLVHLNYGLKWEIFIKLFHIFELRHSLNDIYHEIAALSSLLAMTDNYVTLGQNLRIIRRNLRIKSIN